MAMAKLFGCFNNMLCLLASCSVIYTLWKRWFLLFFKGKGWSGGTKYLAMAPPWVPSCYIVHCCHHWVEGNFGKVKMTHGHSTVALR